MDTFAEHIIVKYPSPADSFKKGMIVAGTILISLLMGIFLLPTRIGSLAVFVIAGVIYGGYYLLTNMNIEYEYSVTNGEFDVDKIISQRKRKKMITFEVKNIESFGKLADARPASDSSVTVLAADGLGENDYYADFRHEAMGDVRLVFTPNRRILEAMKPFMPRIIKFEIDSAME